jgi:hypothetical protein
MKSKPISHPKILLGHLGSFGDCLYATTVARQIKFDFPECHLTWGIGSIYASILDNNPYVDAIWEYSINTREELLTQWDAFKIESERKHYCGEFDEVFFTQVFPSNLRYFDGTLRSSIFRAYPVPITVPVEPVLLLSENEIQRVNEFATKHALGSSQHVILFECDPASGQSGLGVESAVALSEKLLTIHPELKVIMSSKTKIDRHSDRLIDGSCLSFRENAELMNHCSLLVGTSSGISWLSTSNWTKTLPCIQVLNFNMSVYASMTHDHEYFGLPTGHIIEIPDRHFDQVEKCVSMVIQEGFLEAKATYNCKVPVDFGFYFDSLRFHAIRKRDIPALISSIRFTIQRYGITARFLIDAVGKILHTFFVLPFTYLYSKLA